jgi:hypothetical protein
MKFHLSLAAIALMALQPVLAQNGSTFTNFIRQTQLPTGVEWDMGVNVTGESLSPLSIDPGGARFELWTVKSTPLTGYLLDSRYVGTYVPIAQVLVRTEDPYTIIPRTRADRPFQVDVTISGLLADAGAPAASKSVKFLHHVQSYGASGTGVGIDRSKAVLNSQVFMDQNGTQTLSYVINSVPGTDRAKIRGEERFTFYSLEDYQAEESQLASAFVQIWPVADGSLAGITNNQLIRFALPNITVTLNDLYPSSHTYAQVYKGAPQLGRVGSIVPGSSLLVNDAVPVSRVLTLSNYEGVFDEDGQWTMELITETPFGIERMHYVTFQLDRTIQMNSSVTTVE